MLYIAHVEKTINAFRKYWHSEILTKWEKANIRRARTVRFTVMQLLEKGKDNNYAISRHNNI